MKKNNFFITKVYDSNDNMFTRSADSVFSRSTDNPLSQSFDIPFSLSSENLTDSDLRIGTRRSKREEEEESIRILTPRSAFTNAADDEYRSIMLEEPTEEELYISISGLIGAGKTTLATALSEELELPLFVEEVVDTDLLKLFYADKKAWGFALQVSLLSQRFRQQQRIVWSKEGAVQDRSIYEDGVFARVLWQQGDMSDKEYRIYLDLFDDMRRFMSHPSLIVHLDVTPEEALKRIHQRGRDYEISGITLDYLETLHAAYEWFLDRIGGMVHIIRIPYHEYHVPSHMVRVILQEWKKIKRARVISI